ncbi:MAG: hypothetical protein IKZ88_06370 [Neisseriaceae bacterium]|nr:hypothetical protein [Neisseriaceae bacterium]
MSSEQLFSQTCGLTDMLDNASIFLSGCLKGKIEALSEYYPFRLFGRNIITAHC